MTQIIINTRIHLPKYEFDTPMEAIYFLSKAMLDDDHLGGSTGSKTFKTGNRGFREDFSSKRFDNKKNFQKDLENSTKKFHNKDRDIDYISFEKEQYSKNNKYNSKNNFTNKKLESDRTISVDSKNKKYLRSNTKTGSKAIIKRR